MTISTENRVAGPYGGSGTTPTYAFAFKVFAVSDLVITKTVSSVDTTLAYGSDYSVSLNADQDANPGGTITYCVAGVPTNLPVGTSLTITTAIPYTQGTQLTNGGGWYPKVVEYALDRIIAIVQQLKSIADRTIRLPLTVTGVSTSLPAPSPNQLLAWNSTATGMQNIDFAGVATTVAFGSGKVDLFSGTGAQTAFTLSANPGAQANLAVDIDGVVQKAGVDFTWVSGTTLTFTSAPAAGTNNIQVRYVQAVPAAGGLQASLNLSDVDSATAARTNLGLGTMAVQNANAAVITGGAISGASIDNGVIGATTPAAATVTNLGISGTGRRITGDFSNGTASNRTLVQSSTPNSLTAFGLLPNGSSQQAQFVAYGGSNPVAPVNSSVFGMFAGSETSIWNVDISSGGASAGKIVFKLLSAGGTAFGEAMRINANGSIDLAGDSAGSSQALRVTPGSTTTKWVQITGGGASSNASVGVISGSLELSSPVVLSGQTVGTTVGAAGAASALPANPLGYISTTINGVACKIPYYAP